MAATDNSRFLSKTQYEVQLQRLSQVTGRSLGADNDNVFKAILSSADRTLGSWTHPTATARTLTTANQVIKSLTVDAYGHVTAATQAALVAADIPNLAASKINSGTFGIARGGTGLSTWTGAYRIIYSTDATTVTTLAPNTTSTKKFLSMTGTGNAGNAPVWDTLVAGDIPSLAASKITSGTFGVARGGTGLSTIAKGAILYASAADTLAALAANGTSTVKFLSQTSNNAPAWTQLYVGRTVVTTSAANTTLLGVDGFTNASSASASNDLSKAVWDSTNNAWHFYGNIYADGWVSAGGRSEQGGGGGGGSDLNALRDWTNYNATDTGQVLGSNLGKGLADRISDLEQRATNVSFTQAVTSGETLGTITIDGTSKTIVAPLAVTSISLVTASGTNQHKLQINTRNASHSTTASYVDLPSVFAKLASPALTGTPTAPTASAGTNSTQIATTAFVSTAITNAIAGVTQFTSEVSWNGTSTPVVANIPAGVVVTYNGTNYTGTKATGDAGKIYLVYHSHGTKDIYDEYMYLNSAWEKIGNTDIDLTNYWTKTDLVAITATENTTLLNTYFPIPA